METMTTSRTSLSVTSPLGGWRDLVLAAPAPDATPEAMLADPHCPLFAFVDDDGVEQWGTCLPLLREWVRRGYADQRSATSPAAKAIQALIAHIRPEVAHHMGTAKTMTAPEQRSVGVAKPVKSLRVVGREEVMRMYDLATDPGLTDQPYALTGSDAVQLAAVAWAMWTTTPEQARREYPGIQLRTLIPAPDYVPPTRMAIKTDDGDQVSPSVLPTGETSLLALLGSAPVPAQVQVPTGGIQPLPRELVSAMRAAANTQQTKNAVLLRRIYAHTCAIVSLIECLEGVLPTGTTTTSSTR